MSTPTRPDDLLKYFRLIHLDDADVMCVNQDLFFILDQELTRYVKECEACPSFKEVK